MHRGLCLISVGAVLLCGCVKKETPPPAQTVEAPPAAAPAECNTPAPPVKPEHPVVAATRTFLKALTAGDFNGALARSVSEELTEQGLAGLREAFQWDQATFAQAWVDAEQAAVITNPVSAKQGPIALTWAFNLVVVEGRWMIRRMDMLPRQEDVDAYVGAFREVARAAKSIEP